MAIEAAIVIVSTQQTVVVSCTSGRGRSGTLSVIIASCVYILQHIQIPPHTPTSSDIRTHLDILTLDIVIDIIVELRRHRDGLVELPVQFWYICQLLHISLSG